MSHPALRRWPALVICAVALAAPVDRAAAQAPLPESADLSIELVDPKVLRVCADPSNLPFSNDKGEGDRKSVV